jgi:D-beta-D-heptose 7-phosphate kinase/D-beta-D-heptose 1-phosphate adenosyltransferase
MSLISFNDINQFLATYRRENFKLVFTNGCFDLLHKGHLDLLSNAAGFGDKLFVGLNSDKSVKKLKGDSRPKQNERTRAQKLLELKYVNHVIIFEDLTPQKLIHAMSPDVLVKGGDYKKSEIVGSKHVISSGGVVKIVPLTPGLSTTSIIEKRSN